jgi:hypothetical protein
MPNNVQLTAREAPVVFIEVGTNRILDFGKAGQRPVFGKGVLYTTVSLYHVSDIDKYMKQYRDQWRADQEVKIYNQIAKEKPTRDRIKELIRARAPHIDAINRAQNEAMIRVMDQRYETAMKNKLRKEICLTADRWDATKLEQEIAVSDPGFAKVHKIESDARGAIVRRSKEG